MKNILTIIFRLTLSCILAGTVMGTTFVLTNKAKTKNEHAKEERVAFSLLGFEGEVPQEVAMTTVYRYVVSQGNDQFIGYLLESGEGAEKEYTFIQIDLEGELASTDPVALDDTAARQAKERDAAIREAVGPGRDIRFAEQFQVITENGKRVAYLLSGKFPGFKTHIAVMLALRTDFSIIGFEVLEHEEDPGLGGEIEQDYFKNQFNGKPFDVLKSLEVVKEPIPDEYLQALEVKVEPQDLDKIMAEYRGNDIYAITGATISAVAVTDGLKGMTKKFAYRINIMDSVIDSQNISVSL
ncbi:MAG: FMN-binding protein [Desulfopila sp.]|jgi:electron transport complex protein RnfG|nr:FMN-binding protein [Desulfopila sp.]